MSGYKEPGFADRQKAAQQAKKDFSRTNSALSPDPTIRSRQAARRARGGIAAARAKLKTEREAAEAERKRREEEAAVAEADRSPARRKKRPSASPHRSLTRRQRDTRYAAQKERGKPDVRDASREAGPSCGSHGNARPMTDEPVVGPGNGLDAPSRALRQTRLRRESWVASWEPAARRTDERKSAIRRAQFLLHVVFFHVAPRTSRRLFMPSFDIVSFSCCPWTSCPSSSRHPCPSCPGKGSGSSARLSEMSGREIRARYGCE